MLAKAPTTGRLFGVALATALLVALGPPGCTWAENYAKPIYVGRVKASHQAARNQVGGSFFTAEEKKVALEQIDRIQSAYLDRIEMKLGQKTGQASGGWSFDAVTGDRLLVAAQVRALRDDFLPPSGLSDAEKKQGVKTCDAAVCALVANKLPLDFSRTPAEHNRLHLALSQRLWRLRDEAPGANDKNEGAARTPPTDREGGPKRRDTAVDRDAQVRQALTLLGDALARARGETAFEAPDGPCRIDLSGEIRRGADEFLTKLSSD